MKTRRIPLDHRSGPRTRYGRAVAGLSDVVAAEHVAGTNEGGARCDARHPGPLGGTVPISSRSNSVSRRKSTPMPSAIRKHSPAIYTLVAIPAGSVATRSKIGLASAATLPARLPIGMRAASIAIDNVKGVAGLITPGDRVDVIAVPAGGRGRNAARFSDRARCDRPRDGNRRCDHDRRGSRTARRAAARLTTITLALTPNQVDVLAGADMNSTLRCRCAIRKSRSPNLPSEVLKLATWRPARQRPSPRRGCARPAGAAPAAEFRVARRHADRRRPSRPPGLRHRNEPARFRRRRRERRRRRDDARHQTGCTVSRARRTDDRRRVISRQAKRRRLVRPQRRTRCQRA